MRINDDPGQVWRVRYRPEPWGWTPPQFATYRGRWDDSERQFRTIYVGSSLFACLVEVLAPERPEPQIEAELGAIEDPDDQAAFHTEYPGGTIDFTWFDRRVAGSAQLAGRFCHITHSDTVAALRSAFPLAQYGVDARYFDVSYLNDSATRALTRSISRWLYGQLVEGAPLDGIEFRSRDGDDLQLWAVYERPGDPDISPRLTELSQDGLGPEHPDFVAAMAAHGLRWSS